VANGAEAHLTMARTADGEWPKRFFAGAAFFLVIFSSKAIMYTPSG
jgi:hypothetical protein